MTRRVRWMPEQSFSEMACLFLETWPSLSPSLASPLVYCLASDQHLAEPDGLSECAKRHLKLYREMAPDKQFFDLSQDPCFRKRTETKSGRLMTLTCSSKVWILQSIGIQPCAGLMLR